MQDLYSFAFKESCSTISFVDFKLLIEKLFSNAMETTSTTDSNEKTKRYTCQIDLNSFQVDDTFHSNLFHWCFWSLRIQNTSWYRIQNFMCEYSGEYMDSKKVEMGFTFPMKVLKDKCAIFYNSRVLNLPADNEETRTFFLELEEKLNQMARSRT